VQATLRAYDVAHPQYRRKYSQRVKLACLAAYSNSTMQCGQCGFSNPDALALDHINNDGSVDSRKSGRWGGNNFYWKLVKAGFPPGLQVLCCNCNWLKEVERRRNPLS
jgi:hypothetical protein